MPSLGKSISNTWSGALLAALVILIAGCAMPQKGSRAGTYEGPASAIGRGSARAFVALDDEGKPTVLGIRMTEAALSGLPAEPPANADGWEYTLRLPPEAAVAGYDHIGIDWNPKGHIPKGVYDKPHFDFHFYLINVEERNKIKAVGEDLDRAHKAPQPEFMPAGYVLPEGTEVPRMGAHAINPAAEEFHKKPFRKTFIYGFYDGQLIFLEPMLAKAYLDTKPGFSDPVRLPKAYARHAYYPARYGVTYDATRGEYEITLENLEYH